MCDGLESSSRACFLGNPTSLSGLLIAALRPFQNSCTHTKKKKRNTKVLASSTTQQTHTRRHFSGKGRREEEEEKKGIRKQNARRSQVRKTHSSTTFTKGEDGQEKYKREMKRERENKNAHESRPFLSLSPSLLNWNGRQLGNLFVYRREGGNLYLFFYFSRRVSNTRVSSQSLSSAPKLPPIYVRFEPDVQLLSGATISDETPPFHNILESGQTDKLHSETMTSGGTQRGDSHRTDIIIIVYTILYHPS